MFSPCCRFRDADDEGGDELGQEVDPNSIAGGGHAIGGQGDVEARKKLRVSHALRSFLAKVGEIQEADIGGDDSEEVVSILEGPILAMSGNVEELMIKVTCFGPFSFL